jgi:hypothetical protein
MQGERAEQLDVEVRLADRAGGGLPDRRERLREEVLEGLALLEPLPEVLRRAAELVRGQRRGPLAQRADALDLLPKPPQL